jgi:hypothetical protein
VKPLVTRFARSRSVDPDSPHVFVHRDVLRVSGEHVRLNPSVEVGGKFVGYVVSFHPDADGQEFCESERRWLQAHAHGARDAIVVLGSISSGPAARSTSVSLFPDVNFQLAVFRELERQYPKVEHLGSWHSHHPNRLADFSDGDHEHYSSAVANLDYNLDFFLAGLCLDAHGLERGLFDIYTRRSPQSPRRLRPKDITVIDAIPSLMSALHSIEEMEKGVGSTRTLVSRTLELHAEAIEEALQRHFAQVAERIVDADAISWVVAQPGDGVDIVLTYAGDLKQVGVSIRSRNGPVAVWVDCAGIPQDIHRVTKPIERAVRRLRAALKDASVRDKPGDR